MRLNTAHLRRLATTCFVVGLLSLLATPLALAQSGTERSSGGRSTDALAAACPDGFQLTADKSACFDHPVFVTTQGPLSCERGFLSDDSAFCFAAVEYISQPPTQRNEVIDATIDYGAKAQCPAGFTLVDDLTCSRDDASDAAPFAPTVERGTLNCPFGASLSSDDLCREQDRVPALGLKTIRCPTGYTLLDDDVCSGLVAVADNVVSVPPAGLYCEDGGAVFPGDRCVIPGTAVELGDYQPGTPGTPGIPGVAAQPARCPFGTDPTIVENGLCALLNATPQAIPSGGCPVGQIEAPSSYASGQLALEPSCFEALPEIPATPSIPASPAVAPTQATCNGVPTSAGPSECPSIASTQPALVQPSGNPPPCPSGFTTKVPGLLCSMSQPDVKVETPAGSAVTYDSASCPLGYVGPSSNLQCTRTILTAQPDVPVCAFGDLLDVGNGFVCLLEDAPVAPTPMTQVTCPVGELDLQLELCLWPLDTGPTVVEGPITDTLPLAVFAFGEAADAPPTWVFNLSSSCGDSIQFDILTADTLDGTDAYQELPLQFEDADGTPCTYTLTTVPFGDWESSLGLGGIEFTPAVTGVPFVFVQFEQPDYAVIFVQKSAFGDATLPVGEVDIAVSGVCLAAPIVVTVDLAEVPGAGSTEIPVPRLDAAGNDCVYRVEHGTIPGFDSTPPSVQIVMDEAYEYANFTKVQIDVADNGVIRLTKTAEGDPATAPESWQFTIDSYAGAACALDEPIIVEIPSAPTFEGPVTVDIEVPYSPDSSNFPCDYYVQELPAEGFTGVGSGGSGFGEAGVYASFYQGLVAEVAFHNVDLASATGGLAIYVDIFGSEIGGVARDVALTVAVESSCLDETLTFDRSGEFSFTVIDIDELPVSDDDGDACRYDATLTEASGFIATLATDSVTIDGSPYRILSLAGVTANATGTLTILKSMLAPGSPDSPDLPELWEFTISSPCFSPIVVDVPTEAEFGSISGAVDVQVQISDDTSLCEVTVTQTPVDGFAISPPVTQTTTYGTFLFSPHDKLEAGLGLLGDLRIVVRDPDSVELPEAFGFVLTSPCLDDKQEVYIPTSGADLGQPIDTIVPNLPTEADGALCGYSITPVSADGLDFLVTFSEPTLGIFDYNQIEVTVGATGAFGDAAVATLPLLVEAVTPPPVEQPPTPTPGPVGPTPSPTPAGVGPAPGPGPTAVPTPAVGSGQVPVPAPIPVVVSVPSTGVIADAGQVNFGGTTPSTPANFFGKPTATTPKTASPIQALAHTGGNATPLALFGILMILVGAMASIIARRDEPTIVADPFWRPGHDKSI